MSKLYALTTEQRIQQFVDVRVSPLSYLPAGLQQVGYGRVGTRQRHLRMSLNTQMRHLRMSRTHWIREDPDFERLVNCDDARIKLESLILAQNERWRQA